jgi:Glu-tRNA(Gln) amidotransferase subunit E-like FAD-binding protein
VPGRTRGASLCEATSKSDEEDEILMTLQAGDKIVVESEKVAQPSRAGVIEEVLREDPPSVRVRWEDGHTSILTPSAGAARIIRGTRRAKA